MDNCARIQIELMDILSVGETSLSAELDEHLRSCVRCQLKWIEMQLVWQRLGTLRQQEVPASAAQTLRAQILTDLEVVAGNRKRVQARRSALFSILVGVLFSVASAWIVQRDARLSAFAPPTLLSVGALWNALYVGVALVVVRYKKLPLGITASWAALGGLIAMGLFLGLCASCSMNHLLEYCRTSAWVNTAFDNPRDEALYFAVSGLYSSLPVFLAAFVTQIRTRSGPVVFGVGVAGLFLLLRLPGGLLRCASLPLELAASSCVGAIFGASVGGVAGASLRATIAR